MFGNLIKTMIDPRHSLLNLLPATVNQIRQRQTKIKWRKAVLALLCVGLKVLIEGLNRSKFVDFFKSF